MKQGIKLDVGAQATAAAAKRGSPATAAPLNEDSSSSSSSSSVKAMDLVRVFTYISLAVRLLTACLTRTSFHPDEYYQSVEPAYHLVFGGGICTWEWMKEFRIRSLIPLLPLSSMYYFCKLLSWSNLYCLSRTLINGTETSIFIFISYEALRILGKLAISSSTNATIATSTNTASISVASSASSPSSFSSSTSDSLPLKDYKEMKVNELIGLIDRRQLTREGLHEKSELVTLLEQNDSISEKRKPSGSSILPNPHSNLSKPTSAPIDSYSSSYINNFTRVIYYFIILTSFAFYLRPTSVLIVVPFLATYTFLVLDTGFVNAWIADSFNFTFILKAVSISLIPMLICVCLDSYLFSLFDGANFNGDRSKTSTTVVGSHISLTFPLVSFIKFNYINNGSSIFGVKSKFWNFKEGLPTMLGLYTPLLCILLLKLTIRTVFLASPSESKLLSLPPIIRSLLVSSMAYPAILAIFTSHFELRFLLVSLPGFHLFLGYYYYINYYEGGASTIKATSSKNNNASSYSTSAKKKGLNSSVIVLMFILNVAIASYMNFYHQSGPETAIHFINSEIYPMHNYVPSTSTPSNKPPKKLSVYLLAPCYSFPGVGYFLPNIDVHFPKCPIESKLSALQQPLTVVQMIKATKAKKSIIDETALFVSDPLQYVAALLGNKTSCENSSSDEKKSDSFLVGSCGNYTNISQIYFGDSDGDREMQNHVILTFDGYLTPEMNRTLSKFGYRATASFHHAHFRYDYDDPIIKRAIVVLTKH